MSTPRTTGGLTEFEAAALAAVYTHRIVATGQLRRWLGPGHKDNRYVEKRMAALRARRLVDVLDRRNRSEMLWYVTAAGAAAAEESHRVVPRRWRLTKAKVEAGVDWKHTVATNDAGTAILEHALARGHECGPLDWQNEVPHQWGKAGTIGGRGLLVADAVLRLTVVDRPREYGAEPNRTEHTMFLEMDLNTMNLAVLVDKLRAYRNYYDLGSRHWRGVYGEFPDLLIVLDSAKTKAPGLSRRRDDLIRAVQHRKLLATGSVGWSWLTVDVITAAELRAGIPPTRIAEPARPVPYYQQPR